MVDPQGFGCAAADGNEPEGSDGMMLSNLGKMGIFSDRVRVPFCPEPSNVDNT